MGTTNTDGAATPTIEDLNAYNLAALAEVSSPDSIESPGARRLLCVASDASELLEYNTETVDLDDFRDDITERADSAVPVYTHERWAVFVDLGAYTEDIDELGQPGDMTTAAGYALFLIAERLLSALIEGALNDREAEQMLAADEIPADFPVRPVEV